MKKILLIITFLHISFFSFSQLQLTPNLTAQQMAQRISGQGVTITNPVLQCPSGAYGSFANGQTTNLGIDSGIVLTTGTLIGLNGPASNNLSQVNGAPGYTLLQPIANNQQTFDRCLLEFDIVPTCDTLQINYVFGSDEYPTYVNSIYDVFAFFVSGPNPNGGNYNNFNIALVPNTTLPVNIGNVNNGNTNTGPCTNCAYYVNNTNGTTIGYNGLTTPLLAKVATTPNQSYHFILVIADASDEILDSGVFLNFEGLTCEADTVLAVSPDTSICIGDSTLLVASGLVNYTWSPAAGLSSTSGPTVWASPTTTTTYYVTGTNVNGTIYTDSVTVQVALPLISGNYTISDTLFCAGDSTILSYLGSQNGNITWQSSTNGSTWNTISNDSIVHINGLNQSTQFRVILSNACDTIIETRTVTVIPAPNISITQDTSLCQGQTIQLFASGGTSYSWTPNNGTLSSTTSATPICNTPVSQTYYVTVTNQFGCTASDSVRITINGLPTVSASGLLADCGKNNGKIRITGVGGNGTPPYIYSLDGINFQSDTIFTNLAVGAYTVTIEDANGCQAQSSLIGVSEQIITNASFTANGQTEITEGLDPFEVEILNTSTNATNYIWDFGNGQTGDSPISNQTITITYENIGVYDIILIAYDSIPRCSDTISVRVVVDGLSSIEMPNVFSPNGDGVNDVFLPKPFDIKTKSGTRNIVQYNLQIFDRWGKMVFESNDINVGWDGKRKGGSTSSDGVYYWLVKAIGIDNQSYDLKGNVTLLR
ncbi:MAG: choice-of-anchor L domain-containing protein [Bacteroidia bacterium]